MTSSDARPSMPSKIAWDLGDTLVKIKTSKMQEGAARISIQLGHQVTRCQLESSIKDEWSSRKDSYSLDVIRNVANIKSEADYWENDFYPSVLRRLGMLDATKELCAWFAGLQVSPRSFELMPFAKETLELLRLAGIEQALLSNAFPSAKKIVKYHKLEKYFKILIYSFDYKLVKPDARIYELLEEKFNLADNDRIIFVDDRKEFLEIPENLQITPVWLNTGVCQADDWKGDKIFSVEKILSYYPISESLLERVRPAQTGLF